MAPIDRTPRAAPLNGTDVHALADQLLRAASGEPVRVIEALALAMTRAHSTGLAETLAAFDHECGSGAARQAYLRIARRARSGCIPDHTAGANAWHHEDESPDWAKHLIPVAEVGSFLFYRR